MKNTLQSSFSFLEGGGEMGERIRNYDWGKTSLGTPDKWPENLCMTVSLILNSKFPMFLWWGKDLIQFYNDAYRPSLGNNGKHPFALGQKGEDCWPEIWPTIKPLIDKVFSGESTWSENQLIPIYRNGKLEDVYWTFSYSPIKDKEGNTQGVLVICNETTRLVTYTQETLRSEQNLRNTILQSPVGMCILMGPDFIVDIANKKIYELWGTNEEMALGKPIFSFLPEARTQGFEELLNHVYHTGETYKVKGIAYALPAPRNNETVYLDLLYEAFRESNGSISGIIAVATDVTEQVLNYKKTQEAELKARMAIESADLGLFEIELESSSLKTDERFNEIFGVEKITLRKDVFPVFHPEDRDLVNMANEEAIKTGYLSVEYRIIHKDRSIHWIKSNGKVIVGENGKPEKIYGVIQDVTSLKEINQQKDDYISIVSHELKTPVTSMRINSYILLELLANADKQVVSMLKSMNYQVERLSHIIQDLTDVTRLESDKVLFRKEIFDFGLLIKENVAEIQIINQTDRIVITHLEPVTIFADKDRTGQVLTNILTNALKYSPASQKVHVSLIVNDNEAICAVKDFGNGIKKEEQEKIFERFFQVSGNKGVAASGFGLGLYISCQIIERQKGKIWVESSPGEGSTFFFSLPFMN